jgi:hypothetical protein
LFGLAACVSETDKENGEMTFLGQTDDITDRQQDRQATDKRQDIHTTGKTTWWCVPAKKDRQTDRQTISLTFFDRGQTAKARILLRHTLLAAAHDVERQKKYSFL